MGSVYFPSCNFTKASPEAAKRLRAYLKEKMPVAGCCRFDKTPWPAGETALSFCQACRETLEAKPGNQLALENLFVWLAEQEELSLAGLQRSYRERAGLLAGPGTPGDL